MSADNTIAILRTQTIGGYEYRVRELQGVENYRWNSELGCESDNPDTHIANAREMWNGCEVFINESDAMRAALTIEREIMNSDFPVLEYGISTIELSRTFSPWFSIGPEHHHEPPATEHHTEPLPKREVALIKKLQEVERDLRQLASTAHSKANKIADLLS